MVGEVMAGLTAFKTALDTLRGLKDIHDATVLEQAIFTVRREVMEAQTVQMALIEEVSDLKAKIAEFDRWDAEKQRYKLHSIGDRGAFAYVIKSEAKGAEPEHHICANCYERRTKSILQRETWNPGRAHVLSCHVCGSALYLDGAPTPEHASYRSTRRG